MPSGQWLTPNEGATEYLCRPLFIPIDDELYFLASVNGALLELTKVYNWESFGTLTPQEAADAMNEMYTLYATGTCDDGATCPLPFPFEIDIGFPIYIIRLDDEGHWEELIDGVWSTPTGDYEVPAVTTRSESTADERRCLAAANAVAVLEMVYEEATDSFLSDGTQEGVYEAIIGGLLGALGAWSVGFAASGIGLAFAAFVTFYELLETVTDDVWTGTFTSELECLFYNCSTDTSGVVTFDYPCIVSGIGELIFDAGFDLSRQLLFQQVLFMLSIIGADGINIAGTDTTITSNDCTNCDDDWCYTFDFLASNGGFSAYASRAAYNSGSGWGRGSSFQAACQIQKAFGLTAHVNRIEMTFNQAPGTENIRQMRANDVSGGAFLLDVTGVPSPLTYSWDVDEDITGLWCSGVTSNSGTPLLSTAFRITRITLYGNQSGGNPFGADNC